MVLHREFAQRNPQNVNAYRTFPAFFPNGTTQAAGERTIRLYVNFDVAEFPLEYLTIKLGQYIISYFCNAKAKLSLLILAYISYITWTGLTFSGKACFLTYQALISAQWGIELHIMSYEVYACHGCTTQPCNRFY